MFTIGLLGGYSLCSYIRQRYVHTSEQSHVSMSGLIYCRLPSLDVPRTLMPTPRIVPYKSLTMTMDCPLSGGQEYKSITGEVFRKGCGVDWPVGELAADRRGVVRDLMTMKTFTFDSCIDACSTYNADKPATKCLGVSWGVTTAYRGNCWLKANTGVDQQRMVDQRASAMLIPEN